MRYVNMVAGVFLAMMLTSVLAFVVGAVMFAAGVGIESADRCVARLWRSNGRCAWAGLAVACQPGHVITLHPRTYPGLDQPQGRRLGDGRQYVAVIHEG